MFSPFMPIPFLSTKLPGVAINSYGVTEMLSDDRDGVRVNYRREKLEQLSVQQIQDTRFKPASLLNHVRHAKSAFGNPNAIISSARSVLLIRDTRPASL